MSDQRTVLKIKLKSNMTKPKTFWHSMTSSYEALQVMARSPARVVKVISKQCKLPWLPLTPNIGGKGGSVP